MARCDVVGDRKDGAPPAAGEEEEQQQEEPTGEPQNDGAQQELQDDGQNLGVDSSAVDRENSRMTEKAVRYAASQAETVGGFKAFYMAKLQHTMRDIALKKEVEFDCRVLDRLRGDLQLPISHPLFRLMLARVLALTKYDKTGNAAYFRSLAPSEDSLFDEDTERAVDEDVAKRQRTDKQLQQGARSGGGRSRRPANRGGGRGGDYNRGGSGGRGGGRGRGGNFTQQSAPAASAGSGGSRGPPAR